MMHFRKNSAKRESVTDDGDIMKLFELNNYQISNPNFYHLDIEAAIAQMPDGYRKVLILHDIQGCEHEEVALILGIKAGTSKSQLHKARIKLRKLLGKKINPKTYSPAPAVYI